MPEAGVNRANYFFNDNVANGINGGLAVTQSGNFNSAQNYLTNVGVYGAGSESYYGTADQNGNVWEWNDTAITADRRGLRGSSWGNGASNLQSSIRNGYEPANEGDNIGFRVASLAPIPEPGAYAAVAGVVAFGSVMLRRRWRKV
jgi:formylglycine-generating enzyme required for sulfatase activity